MSNKITRYGHKSDSQIIDSLRAENASLRAEVERLRMALADTEALELGTAERCKRWRESYKMQEQQLAASQLEATWLREALDNHSGNYKPSKAERAVINQLIEQPTSTEALDAYVAEKLKDKVEEHRRATLYRYEQTVEIIRQRDLAVSALQFYMDHGVCEATYYNVRDTLAAIKESENKNAEG